MSDERDDRSLKYVASVNWDRLDEGNQKGFRPLNYTLAEHRGSKPGTIDIYVHGNSVVTARVGGSDRSSTYRLLRLRRQWTGQLAQLREAEEATGYVLDTPSSSRFQWNFGEDCTTLPGPWIDTPGEKRTLVEGKPGGERRLAINPKQFANGYRALQEFTVGVGIGIQDWSPVASFGGLHFIMAADFRTTEYRVLMSQARDLTGEELLGAVGKFPHAFPLNIIPKDKPHEFASFPGSTESSGWCDYKGNAS
jgi:hypothetical protein